MGKEDCEINSSSDTSGGDCCNHWVVTDIGKWEDGRVWCVIDLYHGRE